MATAAITAATVGDASLEPNTTAAAGRRRPTTGSMTGLDYLELGGPERDDLELDVLE